MTQIDESPVVAQVPEVSEIPTSLDIVDLNGDKKTIKLKLAWGKEKKLLKVIGELFASVPSEITFGVQSSENPGLALLEYLTKEAPDKITQIVALLLDVDQNLVDEQFDGDAIMEFAIPFVTHYAAKWGERLKGLPLNQMFGQPGNV
jgi:hypothetical protein